MNKKNVAAFALIPVIGVLAYANSAFAASDITSSPVETVARTFMHGPKKDSAQFARDLASVLGLSATDIKAKLDAGQTPDSIINSAGKTESDVRAQLKALRETEIKTKLAAEVSSGNLTQAQADQMLADMANHTNMHGMHKHGHRDSAQFAKDLTSILGTSETDVKAKLDAGQTPDTIITAAGKNVSDVMSQMKALMETSMKAKIQADVTAGKLTQAQADQMLANMGKEHTHGHHGFMGMMHIPFTTTSTSTQ